jgi:hypothetical protein
MESRKVQIALWVVLFLLQALAGGVLTVLLLKQSIETTQPRPFQMSKVYSTVLSEKGQLPVEDQRKLLSLAVDLEKMLDADARLQASTLNVVQELVSALLLFLGFTVILQALIAVMTLRAQSLKTP